MKRVEDFQLSLLEKVKARSRPIIFHPVVFVGGFVSLGLLFALQSGVSARIWNYKMDMRLLIGAWAEQYLIWGVVCWLLWFWLGPQIQQANLRAILTRAIPLSIVVSVGVEMIWVFCFPYWPIRKLPMTYWERLAFELDGELVDNLVIFWCTFLLIRSVGYYEKFREKERSTQQLEVELANAQLRALRMQLNPHFLFNTLNAVSSLMRTEVAAADTMLEQLSCLLRITLERGEAQLIPLSDEMQFVEMYLELQNRRFAGRMRQEVSVDPELYDSLVPAMILQPIIENAYAHGLSLIDHDGLLVVEARKIHRQLKLSVLNTGVGLPPAAPHLTAGHGVGLANVKNRLLLHYGDKQKFFMREVTPNQVLVTMTFPLQYPVNPTPNLTGFGA